jgi:hypothetical protein
VFSLNFQEVVPFAILFTSFICAIIFLKTDRHNLRSNLISIDGVFSILCLLLGLLIILLNLIHSNNYLITLGPLLTITSVIYLHYKSNIGKKEVYSFYLNTSTKKIIDIMYWTSFFITAVNFQQNYPYHRSMIFFISFSLAATLLFVEIYFTKVHSPLNLYYILMKIIFASLFLRYSAYYISPDLVGSDPWAHAILINYIYNSGTIHVPQESLTGYYSYYPIMHIYAASIMLIGNFGIKASLFVIGSTIVFSSLFIYLISKKIFYNNVKIALLCTLLVNLSSYYIQWSTQVIAMSLGIVFYIIIIYLLFVTYKRKILPEFFSKPNLFTLIFSFLIVWTHTISAFILFISSFCLILGNFIYNNVLFKSSVKNSKSLASITLCAIIFILMISHWWNPDYPFFEIIMKGFIRNLSAEHKFLGPLTNTNIEDQWFDVLDIFDFLILIFFGVIGCLYTLSKKYLNSLRFSLIFLISSLFFIFFAFPAFGLKDIVPGRWPAFIYVSFIPFVGFGSFKLFSLFHNKRYLIILFSILLFTYSFFAITNSNSNMDSPFYGGSSYPSLIWTESEITLCKQIDQFYNGTIITDVQLGSRIFEAYLSSTNRIDYLKLDQNENIDYDYIGNKLIIWREMSLSRPMTFNTSPRWTAIFLGRDFKEYIDNNFSKIYTSGGGAAYLKI